MKKRVVVAMSGGVDSSVAAALLVEAGYEAIGITICFNLKDSHSRRPICCGLDGITDARRVAHMLGMKHYVLNMQQNLEADVIKDFCREYLAGRTPNPCVRCNQYIKFGALFQKAQSLDADYLATGHYARIRRNSSGHVLCKAKDTYKDQSYFLYRLKAEQLKYILFPLGGFTKTEVRAFARVKHLPVADKPGSQEICFLPQQDYRAFLSERCASSIKPGPIVDTQGCVLGEHKGTAFYTLGQREGLGIARGYPVYVIRIDAAHNRLVVGKKDDCLHREFLVSDVCFGQNAPKKRIAARVRIRYNHKEAPALVTPSQRGLLIKFREPQFAITPGQSAVIYRRDAVVGGGIIEKILE